MNLPSQVNIGVTLSFRTNALFPLEFSTGSGEFEFFLLGVKAELVFGEFRFRLSPEPRFPCFPLIMFSLLVLSIVSSDSLQVNIQYCT